jgi:hypothetical protein
MRSVHLVLVLVLAVGCGTDPLADVGTEDVGDAARHDTADVPRAALTILASLPSDGARLVPVDVELRVAFSAPLRGGLGVLTLSSDAGAVPLDPPTVDGATVSVRASEALAPGTAFALHIDGFEGEDGSAMPAPVEITFTTEDRAPPSVIASVPSDDGTSDATLADIVVTFSEAMRIDRGSAELFGPGMPGLGSPRWDGTSLHLPVSGLVPTQRYQLRLSDYEDASGNALDLRSLGPDEVLGFEVGPDETPPVVLSSQPNEGQLDLEVALLLQVELTFSEAMDPTRGAMSLVVDRGAPTALVPVWDRGDTRVRASVTGMLGAEAPHRVTLEGFADRAGNALDGAVHLGDGALDFTTGQDSFAPFVAFLTPEEGDPAVLAGTDRILVTFSEAMPPDRDTITLVGDGRSLVLRGTWAAGNTILTIPAPMLQGGRTYSIDFTGFADPGGTLLDRTHPYLGDGIATFTIDGPTGERCGDALTENEGVVSGASVTWSLPAGSFGARDGEFACDRFGASYDGVLRFRKVGADTVLHVHAETMAGDIDVEIFRETCRPESPEADTARLRCMPERGTWDSWLEVPAGDYFVWVATDFGTPFDGATVTIEEVASVRPGEDCSAPLDETAGELIYTGPGEPESFHRWVIPAGYADAPDRSVYPSDPEGALSCLPSGTDLGPDVVVGFDKTSASSLVTVRVSMPDAANVDAAVEIVRGCAPPSATPLACLPYADTALFSETTFDGPPGPLSVWLVDRRATRTVGDWTDTPETTIEIAEFEVGLGDSCATAIPLLPGTTNPVSAERPHRAYVPACMRDGGVTWFRYTPTRGLGLLRTDGASVGAVVDRASGRVLRCGDDASSTLPVFGIPGQEVCIALTSSPSVHTITIDELDYDGVRGIETEVPIVRDPSLPSVSPSLGTSGWLATLGTEIWRGGFSLTVGVAFHAPQAGGLYSWIRPGLNCRYAGVSRPDGIYCVSEITDVDQPRLYRIVDGAGVAIDPPVAIDVLGGVTYPPRRFDGLAWDGASFLVGSAAANTTSTDPTSYYAIETDGTVTSLGTNTAIHDVGALAADATFLYVYGRAGAAEGIFRLRRSELDDPAQIPVEIAGGYDLISDGGSIAIDATTEAHALYFRTIGNTGSRADVIVVVDPAAPTPSWVGPLWRAPGNAQNNGLGLDPSGPTLWLVHTNGPGGTSGRWVRLD